MKSVVGDEETYIRERQVKENPAETLPVDVDDSTMWLCRYENGAQGVMQASKVAIGNAPGVEVRIYGSLASAWIRLVETPEGYDKLWMADRNDMHFRPVDVPNDFKDNDWPRNYYAILVKDFLRRIREGDTRTGCGDFYDGLICQEIMSAIEESMRQRAWVNLT